MLVGIEIAQTYIVGSLKPSILARKVMHVKEGFAVMLVGFSRAKDSLLGVLDRIEWLARTYGNPQLAALIGEASDRLKLNAFNLVVLGQFKRGKSSLINALLGENVLPTGVIPLTSIVTRIRYGPVREMEVRFNDGSVKLAKPEQVDEYVTEAQNPNNAKGVKYVTLTFPSRLLRNGVTLVDTPGIGSTYTHNTNTTYAYLPHADAAIFVFSVDPPMSQEECRFLRDIRRFVSKIFFVINKIDYIPDFEMRQAIEFAKQVLERELGVDSIQIHPVSAKLALEGKLREDPHLLEESQLPDFESFLETFLMKEKGDLLLASVAETALRILSDLETSVDIQRKALAYPLNELMAVARELDTRLRHLEQDKIDNSRLLEGEIRELGETVATDVEAFKERETASMIRRLDERRKGLGLLGNKDFRRELEEFVEESIVLDFEDFRQREEQKVRERFKEITSRFVRKTNDLIERVNVILSKPFGIEIEPFSWSESLIMESEFHYLMDDTESLLSMSHATASALLPRPISRKIIWNEVKERAEMLVDRHCGRITHDFRERIRKSFQRFSQHLDGKIGGVREGIQAGLKRAIEGKRRGELRVSGTTNALNQTLIEIRKLREELRELRIG